VGSSWHATALTVPACTLFVAADVPLGFGVTAKSTSECRAADPNAIVVFHQADCGEYLRAEDEL
jgi:60S ribosome subunit biogenesis protein NIP7